jgi:nanoRNase/pAp phosphatase (c-di-AMP/oligoRNAs hydrolase)
MNQADGYRQKLSEIARLLAASAAPVIVLHPHADPDCVASACALSAVFGIHDMWSPARPDRSGNLLLMRYQASLQPEFPEGATAIIVVDTNDITVVPERFRERTTVVIDHHETVRQQEPSISLTDSTAPSCSEIVYDLITCAGHSVDSRTAKILLAGILADTGRLRRARPSTLRKCAHLLETAGVDITSEELSAEGSRDIAEQTAVLKGMQRMFFRSSHGFTVCCSHSSSFESSVAHMLLAAGADAAFVASEKRESVRVTGRAAEGAVGKGFSLIAVFGNISRGFGGTFGGHAGAAVLSSEGDMEAILNACAAECEEWNEERQRKA